MCHINKFNCRHYRMSKPDAFNMHSDKKKIYKYDYIAATTRNILFLVARLLI